MYLHLSICHLNARSIFAFKSNCKLEELSLVAACNNFDVICVSESWLDSTIDNDCISLNGYLKPFWLDRNSHGGGGMAGSSQAGGQWCPAPPFEIGAPHFTFGPPVAAYIQHCILKCGPPSGFWPLFLVFGPPAAKSWRLACVMAYVKFNLLCTRRLDLEVAEIEIMWFDISFTTFTCQATVRQNETTRSDIIVPFGLHV